MTTDTTVKGAYKEYREDIARMVDYCGDYGIQIPEPLGPDVAKLPDLSETQGPTPDQLAAIISVHGRLSALISPATPRSLDATEVPPRNSRAWLTYAFMGFLIAAAAIGVVGYIKTLPVRPPAQKQPQGMPSGSLSSNAARTDRHKFILVSSARQDLAQLTAPVEAAGTAESTRTQWNYFYAAVLGASFNGLFTAYKYLVNRSFDSGYVVVYVIRFVLGLVAGMILGNLGAGLFAGDTTLSKLGPGMISLLGGYSAEAVRQILDRLVEVLVSAVRGDGAAVERVDVARDVIDVVEVAAKNNATPQDVRDKLNGLLRKLRQ